MRQVVVNERTIREIIRSREGLLGGMDAKRPSSWDTFGYQLTVTFDLLLQAYQRNGAAHGAVHRILDKCWAEHPRIKQKGSDDETQWEESVEAVLRAVNGWQKLRDFDRRNMIGRYAGLILRVADNQTPDQPMKTGKLVDLVPVYEDQLRVANWDNDTNSPAFGQPTMWEYRSRRPQQGTEVGPERWQQLHPSRVLILAEGSVGDHLDGVPLLLAGFNHLSDLEKIAGGSGESYLKNSARTLVLKFGENASVSSLSGSNGTPEEQAEAAQEKTDRLNQNLDSSIILQGGDASTLQTTVHDPEPSFRVAANLFSASVQIPFTILFGQQTGRLASDQDRQDFAARCASRQENDLTPMLQELVRRLQAVGSIEAGEFEIEWPRVDAPSEKDKVEILGKMTSAMQQAFQAGLAEPLFDADELRAVVDYDPLAPVPGMPGEGAPALDPPDPAAVPPQPRALRAAA